MFCEMQELKDLVQEVEDLTAELTRLRCQLSLAQDCGATPTMTAKMVSGPPPSLISPPAPSSVYLPPTFFPAPPHLFLTPPHLLPCSTLLHPPLHLLYETHEPKICLCSICLKSMDLQCIELIIL